LAQAKLKQGVSKMEMQNEGPENAGTTSEQRANLQNARAAGWLALAERCEQATGPDRVIDDLLMRYLGYVWKVGRWNSPDMSSWLYGDRTSSLDAITALIERELVDWDWSANYSFEKTGKRRGLAWLTFDGRRVIQGRSATPALALCAAFCRAMAEKESRS
jgi:hypothetical protein